MKNKEIELSFCSWRSIIGGDKIVRISFREPVMGPTTLHLEILKSDALEDEERRIILLIMGRIDGIDSFFHGCITQRDKEEYSLSLTTDLEEDVLHLFQQFPNSSLEIFDFLRECYVKEAIVAN